ncbi:hypothetical protein [Amniculibacterium sp. G2-70]|uniref:hypothetical protein n=1 Tax=Amniculibacterium sp. G2-70 TaxID=2767188 RepID=UPI001654805D|nr:hypothetical protein [Amniculibacterium sp. G2-70]
MEKLLQFILIFSSIFTFSQIEIKIAPSDKRFPSTQYIKIEILNKSNHNYIVPLDTLDLRPFDDNYDWKDFDKKGVVEGSLRLQIYMKDERYKQYLFADNLPIHVNELLTKEFVDKLNSEYEEKLKEQEEWKKMNNIEDGIDIEKNRYLTENMIFLRPNEKITFCKKVNDGYVLSFSKSQKIGYFFGLINNKNYKLHLELVAPKNIKKYLSKKQKKEFSKYKIFTGIVKSNIISFKFKND